LGEVATFECLPYGSPFPTIKWMKASFWGVYLQIKKCIHAQNVGTDKFCSGLKVTILIWLGFKFFTLHNLQAASIEHNSK
jgi:hypothetical protein